LFLAEWFGRSEPSRLEAFEEGIRLCRVQGLITLKLIVWNHDGFGVAAAGEDVGHATVNDIVEHLVKLILKISHVDGLAHHTPPRVS
jgi:hypothetical protein